MSTTKDNILGGVGFDAKKKQFTQPQSSGLLGGVGFDANSGKLVQQQPSSTPSVPSTPATTPSATPGSTETAAPWGDGSFTEWYLGELNKQHASDEERFADEEKRLERNRVMATIGDGLSAFHEAYAKARGVEPMTSGAGLSQRLRDRYDRLMAERNANRKAYLNGYLEMMRQKRADAVADENAQYRRDSIALRQQREENQKEMNSAKLKYWDAKQKGETEKAEYYSKLYELVANGMTEKDARVALGIEPKTTYTVTDKHDSSGKNTTTVTTRTGNPDVANQRIDDVNARQTPPAASSTGGGGTKSGGKKSGSKSGSSSSGTSSAPSGGKGKGYGSGSGNKNKQTGSKGRGY